MPGGAALDVLITEKTFTSPAGIRHVVLRNIRLTAFPGQVIALLGRSGIGKSTLLRIVLGLDGAFEGKVRVPAGRVGVVFQEPRLLPWLTVEDNLRLVMQGAVADARIENLLEQVGIAGVARQRPSELSLGMARRVALARALAVEPNLLVLDEPFASLDRQLGATLVKRVADRTRSEGGLMLFATHELEHALTVADSICILAGQPATLESGMVAQDRNDGVAIARLRADLLERFPFLGSEEMAHPP